MKISKVVKKYKIMRILLVVDIEISVMFSLKRISQGHLE